MYLLRIANIVTTNAHGRSVDDWKIYKSRLEEGIEYVTERDVEKEVEEGWFSGWMNERMNEMNEAKNGNSSFAFVYFGGDASNSIYMCVWWVVDACKQRHKMSQEAILPKLYFPYRSQTFHLENQPAHDALMSEKCYDQQRKRGRWKNLLKIIQKSTHTFNRMSHFLLSLVFLPFFTFNTAISIDGHDFYCAWFFLGFLSLSLFLSVSLSSCCQSDQGQTQLYVLSKDISILCHKFWIDLLYFAEN